MTVNPIGPAGVPIVATVAEAEARPELAVLSAMAHGRTDAGLDVAVAALAGSAGIHDEKRKALYVDLVLVSLGEAARRAFEALMLKNYEYQSDFARKYFADGRAQGLADGRTEGLLEGELKPLVRQFERRLARPLSADERARLTAGVRELAGA